MPKGTILQRFLDGTLLPWAAAALVVAAGVWVALTLRSARQEDPSLPPGFTITPGGDSGPRPGGGGEGEAGSLGALIAATLGGEGDAFAASIAVLPFRNETGAAPADTLANGLRDELLARLYGSRGLKVISRQSVQELEGLELSIREVADTLGVDHLILGRVYPYQAAARVEVQLLAVEGEVVLWGNDYSLDPINQMRAAEEIWDEVSTALLVERAGPLAQGRHRTTESPGYVAYLAGSRLLNTRSREGVLRAIDAFRTAIGRDSTLALAYAGLSSAYALSITYRYDIGVDGYAAAGLALKAADQALALEPELAEGYAARGYIASIALAPAQRVHGDFARAMELQPNAPNVRAWYANLLIREGFYDQALAEAEQAVELDPLSPARRTGLAYEALRARDYALAVEQARVALTLEADVLLPRSIEAMALLLGDQALDCLGLDMGPHAGIRAMCLHAVGRVEEARSIVDSLRTGLWAGGPLHPEFTSVLQAGDVAAYLAWTGSPERAMPWIHRAYAHSPSGIDPRVLESGLFDGLLENPQLRRAVEDIRTRIWARVLREEEEARL